MISLRGRRPEAPILLATRSQMALEALIAKTHTTPTEVFKETDFPNHWGEHKHRFILPQYKGKCAYCETPIISGTPGDVEHFRPKAYCQTLEPAKNRDDYGGQPPSRRRKGTPDGGYWWLAYEWSNYLLSCNRCNSIWKQNQFPVEANRTRYGGNLATEKALLINPFDTDPEPHFAYDANTGQIRGLTKQGSETIKVCGLDRRSLESQRALKGARLLKRYKEYLIALSKLNTLAQDNALRCLLDECGSKEPYAAVARYFVKHKLKIDYPTLLKLRRMRSI